MALNPPSQASRRLNEVQYEQSSSPRKISLGEGLQKSTKNGHDGGVESCQ